ncbi:MAG: NADPH-dependent F420 reductase [Polyangia bacterium]
MKISIIGAGMIGGTLGKLWHDAGHTVHLATRHPAKLKKLISEIGPHAKAGTPEEAIQGSEAVLLAVPLFAIPMVAASIAKLASDKAVLDACNAYPQRDGAAADEATRNRCGSSGWVLSHFPGARVVKAFNTVYFKVLQTESRRGVKDGIGIPLASDDANALALAEQLVRDAGFSPVVVGPLSKGKLFEPGTAVYATNMRASRVARALGGLQ